MDIDGKEDFNLNIRIGNHVIKRLDTYNIVLQEIKIKGDKSTNPGEEYESIVSYHKTLFSAIDKVLRMGIEKRSINKLSEVASALKNSEKSLYKALNDEYGKFDV